MATDVLKLDSPAQMIVSGLRRTILLQNITMFDANRSRFIADDILRKDLTNGHVFDMAHWIDAEESGGLPTPILKGLTADSESLLTPKMGLFSPFPITILVSRWAARKVMNVLIPPAFKIALLTETESEIIITAFMTRVDQDQWNYLGQVALSRFEVRGTYDGNLNSPIAKTIPGDVLMLLALLNRKGNAVVVEPAAWTLSDDITPKAFQRPNPSVSIVRVNTDRILRPTSDDDGSGGKVSPHDRRAHIRRRGRKLIQVRSSKIHGGVASPTTKVVIFDNPL